MKKSVIIIFIICLCVLLTGCGNDSIISKSKSETLNCSKNEIDENGYSTTENIVTTYKKSKITKIEQTTISETDPQFIKFSLNVGNSLVEKLNTIDGITANYTQIENNKLKFVLAADFSKLNSESIKKALGDLYDEENAVYSNLDITIDDFKEDKIADGYKCN